MDLQNIFNKKIKRKNFFLSLGAFAGGYFLMRSLPFRIFGKRLIKPKNISQNKIKIRINPSAVSRTKIGENNGRS